MPKLHINVLAYNEEHHIEQCIDSILRQTFTDFVVVVHDNHSTDRTVEICRTLARLDRRLMLNEGAFNIGSIAQVSKALCGSNARYVALRSANDFMAEDYYAATLEILENDPSCGLAYSHGYEFREDPSNPEPASDAFRIDTRGMSPVQSCVEVMSKYAWPFALWGVYRRDCFERCRPYQYAYGGDHVLVAEMALYGSIAATAERLDWRRNTTTDVPAAVMRNARTQLEEATRGMPENTILYGLKQDLPFTDMAFAHFEMLGLARVSDQLKKPLLAAAGEIFRARFGESMKVEALGFFDRIDVNDRILMAAANPQDTILYLFLLKAFRELDKIRILGVVPPEPIAQCEETLRRIRTRVTGC